MIKLDLMLKNKIGEEAFNIERVYFVKTDRVYNPRKTNPLKFLAGSVPVLVSAPHSVRHLRQKRIKPSDEFTGSMAYLLNKMTGCHALAVTKLYGGDPNFDDSCLYKDFLNTLAVQHKLKIIIDLHGASREHDFDVDIGTINGLSLLEYPQYSEALIENFRNYGLVNISENHFSISGQNTVTSYVSSVLGIPAVQLEINKKFRVPHQKPEGFCRVLGALVHFIENINKIK